MDQKMLDKLAEVGRESADRRGFLVKAGKAAAVVPAVALLLSAQATPAEAFGRYGKKRAAKRARRVSRHRRGHSRRRGRGRGRD